MTYKFSLQMKRDTAAQWDSSVYIPLEGEPCYDSTNVIFKIGNGVDLFKDLPAINGVFEGGDGAVERLTESDGNVTHSGWCYILDTREGKGIIGQDATDFSIYIPNENRYSSSSSSSV